MYNIDHELNEFHKLFYAERYDNNASEMRRITRIGWRSKNSYNSY